MKSNVELRALAWKRLWADKWFGRLFGGGLLLGLCCSAVQVVISGILGRLNVQTWQNYFEAVLANRQDLTTPVPNLTPEFISQATSSSILILFFSYLMAGIAAYGGAVILLKCLATDEKDWLSAAFGGFKWPFEMLWMFVRLVLTYLGWFLLGMIPLAAVALSCRSEISSVVESGSLPAVLTLSFLAAAGLLVPILLACVPFYRYRFLFLVKAEQPELGANACFRTCRELMKGSLMTSFRLDCSYWRPITGLLLLCLVMTCGALALTQVPTWAQLVLGALLLAGLVTLFACSIVLSQYIGVGQGFLYQEIKDGLSANQEGK